MSSQFLAGAFGAAALALFGLLLQSPALADQGHSHGQGHGSAVGEPAQPGDADRTVEVTLYDSYFTPEAIEVSPGETLRFVVRNEGELVHEFGIGTAAMHEAHQEEMMEMMEQGVLLADRIDWEAAEAMHESMGHGMHHDANSLLLEPGQSGELVWTFPEAGELLFACNVPGHYAAGMHGEFRLAP